MLQRRDFLSASAASLTAATQIHAVGTPAAVGKRLPDVAVVGAGVFGAFAALSSC